MHDELRSAYESGALYFGDALRAYQGDHRHRHFKIVVDAVRAGMGKRVLDLLEVGSWAGGSLIAWANACERDCRIVSIDHWRPYIGADNEHHAEMTRAAATGEIIELFWHNISVAGIDGLVNVMQGESADMLARCPSKSFDIVFVDSDHRYDFARRDIALSMPLVRDGGILCGDDLELQHAEAAHLPTYMSNEEFIRFNADGAGYHPGVTRSVHELFGPVSCIDGLWFMQLVDGRWKPVEF